MKLDPISYPMYERAKCFEGEGAMLCVSSAAGITTGEEGPELD